MYFRVLFLYELRSKHNAATAARKINAVFGNGSVNERTTRRWNAKFKTGNENLTNEDRGRPESVVTMQFDEHQFKKNRDNSVRDYAKELGVSSTTISCHLKLIGKEKKMDKWVSHDLDENHKRKRFETSSALLRNQNDLFVNRKVDEKWILYDNRKHSAQ